MIIRVGKSDFESTFTENGWRLVGKDEKDIILIPYSKIYNYFTNKVHTKTDIFTLFLILPSMWFLTPWIALVFLFPAFFFYHYYLRIRLDTEQGTIFLRFNSIEDKLEFEENCKKYVQKQRWKNMNVKADYSLFNVFYNKFFEKKGS